MTIRDHILAIDNGTQSVRALVFDPAGNLVAREKVDLEPYYSDHPGWAEQDPLYYWRSLCEACRGLWMVSWFRDEFGHRERRIAERRGIEPEDLFDELVNAVPAGSMGLVLQPYWSPGVRLPGPEAKGAVVSRRFITLNRRIGGCFVGPRHIEARIETRRARGTTESPRGIARLITSSGDVSQPSNTDGAQVATTVPRGISVVPRAPCVSNMAPRYSGHVQEPAAARAKRVLRWNCQLSAVGCQLSTRGSPHIPGSGG